MYETKAHRAKNYLYLRIEGLMYMPEARATMAAVLAEGAKPLSIDDLLGAVEARVGFRPAEFQVRVALRFWLYRQPPVVLRNRARYSSSSAIEMIAAAQALWEKISQ